MSTPEVPPTGAPDEGPHDADSPQPLLPAGQSGSQGPGSRPAGRPDVISVRPMTLVTTVAVLVGVAAAAVGVIAGYAWGRSSATATGPSPTVTVTAAAPAPEAAPVQPTIAAVSTAPFRAKVPRNVNDYGAVVIGTNPDAPVADVYIDYQCPYCKALEDAFASRWDGLARDGSWQFAYSTMAFLGEPSIRAANAAACVVDVGGPAAWLEYSAAVYAVQDPTEPPTQYDNDTLVRLARETGVPEAASCITGGTYIDFVTEVTERSFGRGVTGTPSVIVDDQRVSPEVIT